MPRGETKHLFESAQDLRQTLLALEPKRFVSHHIFEPVPYAFDSDSELWIEWKTLLAELLDVDPYNIVMTGSAAVGFSLNPAKGFRAFNAESDFDCGVVSEYHFTSAWRYLCQQQVSWLSLESGMKEAIRSHKNNFIFLGTIATDRMLSLLPFGLEWQVVLEQMAYANGSMGREVKLRIYKDYDSLRRYQARNVERLRNELLVETAEQEVIEGSADEGI